jgi:hypothetical protein
LAPARGGARLAVPLLVSHRYTAAGVKLAAALVGLGSVCRRQASGGIAAIMRELHALGPCLHGFGVKTRGLAGYADGLASADSMAWSYAARRRPPLPGCVGHRTPPDRRTSPPPRPAGGRVGHQLLRRSRGPGSPLPANPAG